MYSKISLESIHTQYLNILHEGQDGPDPLSYASVVMEILSALRPSSQRDRRLIEVSKKHLQEIVRHVKRLNEQISVLQEQIQIINEEKEK